VGEEERQRLAVVGRKWGRSRSARRRRTTLSATRREFSLDSDVILVVRNHGVVGGIMCSRMLFGWD
jgi:hypothetical protein